MSITAENQLPKVFLGIDLGKEGALHLAERTNHLFSERDPGRILKPESMAMPLDKDRELDIEELHRILSQLMKREGVFGHILVVFEHLTPLHKSSKSDNWSLARQAGAVEALCIALGLKYIKVFPKIWQQELLRDIAPLRKKDGTTDTKARALLKVQALFPGLNLLDPIKKKARVPHNGIVDAVLLAEYGRRSIK